MRKIARTMLMLPLAACAVDDAAQRVDPSIEETRVYLQSVRPDTVSYIRYMEPLRYDVVNRMYVTIETQTGLYLVEMTRICRALTFDAASSDTADERRMRGRLRAGVDTIRGCRIKAIYKLPEPAVETTGTEDGQTQDQ